MERELEIQQRRASLLETTIKLGNVEELPDYSVLLWQTSQQNSADISAQNILPSALPSLGIAELIGISRKTVKERIKQLKDAALLRTEEFEDEIPFQSAGTTGQGNGNTLIYSESSIKALALDFFVQGYRSEELAIALSTWWPRIAGELQRLSALPTVEEFAKSIGKGRSTVERFLLDFYSAQGINWTHVCPRIIGNRQVTRVLPPEIQRVITRKFTSKPVTPKPAARQKVVKTPKARAKKPRLPKELRNIEKPVPSIIIQDTVTPVIEDEPVIDESFYQVLEAIQKRGKNWLVKDLLEECPHLTMVKIIPILRELQRMNYI